jgi:hypothetical protein
VDYVKYYSLEQYLFDVVHPRFRSDGSLSAFDFFSIIVWKANRAKSKVARRLIDKDADQRSNLEEICRDLTRSLHEAPSPRERLELLMTVWGFRLPMASAVLTVLWPEEFGVYDIRVCDELRAHHRLANLTRFESIWVGYEAYLNDVRLAGPSSHSLRDQDRYLWGRSAARQLEDDIRDRFGITET